MNTHDLGINMCVDKTVEGIKTLINNSNNLLSKIVRMVKWSCSTMLPRSIPPLSKEQWEFIEQRLDKPAPQQMQERLQEAIKNAKKINHE